MPLEQFIQLIQELGLRNCPDLEALLARLPNARGPEIPGILMQVMMYLPSEVHEAEAEFSDWERF